MRMDGRTGISWSLFDGEARRYEEWCGGEGGGEGNILHAVVNGGGSEMARCDEGSWLLRMSRV